VCGQAYTPAPATEAGAGDFKDAFMDVVIDAKDASNSIADQLLKDERIFGVMQQMLAKMVWQQFQNGARP
jgi:hypothetical protein